MGSRQIAPVEVPGSASVVLADGVSFLHPEDAVLDAMLEGWAAQQHSRLLAASTVENRGFTVRRFVVFTNEYPWRWGPADVEEWTSSLVGEGLAHSTIRNYQMAVGLFLAYVCDARYGWAERCEGCFGTHPVQIFHEWNTAVHRSDGEGRPERRPLSRLELQRFFDHCDERVAVLEGSGRKGWLAAFRDAVLFKTIYAWGLRRREAAMLDVGDWGPNPRAGQFGSYGVLRVRYGKASRGGPPRARTVLTTMGWAAQAVGEWVEEVRPAYQAGKTTMMWPTERGSRIGLGAIDARFAEYRDALGMEEALTPHCLRHSHISHQLEDGADQLFIQQQVGHVWASTLATYTKVGSDYMQDALGRALRPAWPENGELAGDKVQ